MEAKNIQLISSTQLYMIQSAKTGHIYVDKSHQAYMYEDETEATGFCETQKTLRLSSPRIYKPEGLIQNLYNCGVKTLAIRKAKQELIKIPIDKADAPINHYNPEATYNLLRLLHTGEKKYLRRLKEFDYIAAAYIPARKTGEYPKLHYAYARLDNEEDNREDKEFLLLFTTVHTFQTWQEQIVDEGVEYSPIMMSLERFRTTVGETALCVNPGTEELYLTKKQVEKIYT